MAKLTAVGDRLFLGGEELKGEVGWNCAYLLARRWYSQNDTEHIRIIDALAGAGVRVVRVFGMPNAPGTSSRTSGNWDTWGTPESVPSGNSYTDLSATFYTKHREVLDYCATKGVSVIVCILSRMATLADLKGETQSVGFNTAGSATRTFARTIFANYVNALKDHTAVAAWEINNEWNNYAELQALPDATTGTPTYTSPGDLVSVQSWRDTMIELAGVVKENDSSRCVLTGNAGGWNTNRFGLDGYTNFLASLNPDPFDTVSIHSYSDPSNNLYLQSGMKPLRELMRRCKDAASKIRKPFIIGEIGVRENLSTKNADWNYLSSFLTSDDAPPLTLLWNFYPQGLTLPTSNPNYDCFPGDPRAYQVTAATVANGKGGSAALFRSSLRPPQGWLDLQGGQCVYRSLPIAFSGSFTIAFWARFVNARDGANFARILSTSNETSNGFHVLHQPTTNEPYLRFYNGSGGQSTLDRQGRIGFNKWNHFAYRFNASTLTIETFFNGFQAAADQSSYTGSWVAPLGNFVIGGNNANANNFKGQLSQVTVVNRTINDEEIFDLACGKLPPDGLQWLGNGIDADLTVVGAPSWQTQ